MSEATEDQSHGGASNVLERPRLTALHRVAKEQLAEMSVFAKVPRNSHQSPGIARCIGVTWMMWWGRLITIAITRLSHSRVAS